MKMRTLCGLVLGAATFVLTGCGGQGAGNVAVAPSPGPTCKAASAGIAQLIYPLPGAVGVPDNVQQIVVAVGPQPLPTTYNAVLDTSPVLDANANQTAAFFQIV